jgi:hypothetical protein
MQLHHTHSSSSSQSKSPTNHRSRTPLSPSARMGTGGGTKQGGELVGLGAWSRGLGQSSSALVDVSAEEPPSRIRGGLSRQKSASASSRHQLSSSVNTTESTAAAAAAAATAVAVDEEPIVGLDKQSAGYSNTMLLSPSSMPIESPTVITKGNNNNKKKPLQKRILPPTKPRDTTTY